MSKRFKIGLDLVTIEDTSKEYGALNQDEVVDLLNELHEENEQLKFGNKNLKAILNDFINILNRLQSNPNNEQTLNVARDMLQNMGKELKE
jgi:hypothetical protein